MFISRMAWRTLSRFFSKPNSGVCAPEIDEHDFSAQTGWGQRRRIQPRGGAGERRKLSFEGQRRGGGILGRGLNRSANRASENRGKQERLGLHDRCLPEVR
jgi:hypothetical protein